MSEILLRWSRRFTRVEERVVELTEMVDEMQVANDPAILKVKGEQDEIRRRVDFLAAQVAVVDGGLR